MDTTTQFPHLPTLVVHADWSCHPKKRWMAQARLEAGRRYYALAPEPVKDVPTFFDRLRAQAGPHGAVLAGFDFPIGLPRTYAAMAEIDDFLTFLPRFGRGDWADFYEVAALPGEINLRRPFYPQKPGNARQAYLLDGLNLSNIDQLRRKCERAHNGRRAAAPLFWTLGGQQVGKAAICGWRQLLAPALQPDEQADAASPPLAIWPFAGQLKALLLPGKIVVAETYPAECYNHLGLAMSNRNASTRSGKRSPQIRSANAPRILAWAQQNNVLLDPALVAAIQAGFGQAKSGEDPFDSLVGLFGMLNVLLGNRPAGDPQTDELRRVEGWILGQQP